MAHHCHMRFVHDHFAVVDLFIWCQNHTFHVYIQYKINLIRIIAN